MARVVRDGPDNSNQDNYSVASPFLDIWAPEQVMLDNGPQFTSEEFATFVKANGIKHVRVAPYHPASNGLSERFVRTFKQAMRTGKHDGLTQSHRLETFLLTYRSTRHATTGEAPCSLFQGRIVQTRLRFDLLRPSLER